MRFRRSPHTSSTSAPAAATRSCSAAPWTSETTLIRMAAPSGGSDAGRPHVLGPCYGWSGTVRPRTAGIMDGSTNGGWRAVAGRAGGGDLWVRLPGVARVEFRHRSWDRPWLADLLAGAGANNRFEGAGFVTAAA